MKKTLDKILEYGKFIESRSIDPTAYYTFKTHKRNGVYSIVPLEFQVMFHLSKIKWEWRVVGKVSVGTTTEQILLRAKEPWEQASFSELVDIMVDHGVNLDSLEKKLKHTILQNAVFANSVLTETIDLLGHYDVAQAIEDDARFIQELSEIIKQVLGVKKSTETDNVVSIRKEPEND